MKFKIRYADQIVGLFVVLSLAALVFVIAALGRSQRWFARDLALSTVLTTAAGLNKNMPVQYRGFNIGSVKDFRLEENDEVEVIFIIFEEYRDRARVGSMVEMMSSPIGLGNQFLFYAGRGAPHNEGDFVPVYGSEAARALISQGLAAEIHHDDSITALLSRVNYIVDDIGSITSLLREALGAGSDITEIGRIVSSIQASLESFSSILDNLDNATAFVPGQLPQLAGLIVELRTSLQTAEDLMTALNNNPLLRGGVPGRQEAQDNAANPRGIRF
ncbi:MAG: MlaD family protein [Treponema sp.]|nr:MlaD family protein [Treponema sp.]